MEKEVNLTKEEFEGWLLDRLKSEIDKNREKMTHQLWEQFKAKKKDWITNAKFDLNKSVAEKEALEEEIRKLRMVLRAFPDHSRG